MDISIAAVNQVLYVQIITKDHNNMYEPMYFLVQRYESSNVRYEGKIFS